jgi:hypothetical protein
MEIVKKLAAELKVELAVETGNTRENILALLIHIKLVVKTLFLHSFHPFSNQI